MTGNLANPRPLPNAPAERDDTEWGSARESHPVHALQDSGWTSSRRSGSKSICSRTSSGRWALMSRAISTKCGRKDDSLHHGSPGQRGQSREQHEQSHDNDSAQHAKHDPERPVRAGHAGLRHELAGHAQHDPARQEHHHEEHGKPDGHAHGRHGDEPLEPRGHLPRVGDGNPERCDPPGKRQGFLDEPAHQADDARDADDGEDRIVDPDHSGRVLPTMAFEERPRAYALGTLQRRSTAGRRHHDTFQRHLPPQLRRRGLRLLAVGDGTDEDT